MFPLWWAVESLFHRFVMSKKITSWRYKPVDISERDHNNLLNSIVKQGIPGSDEALVISAKNDYIIPSHKQIKHMIRVWNREPGVRPPDNTFLAKSKERLNSIAKQKYIYFPALGWWAFHKIIHTSFEFGMISLGFSYEYVDGIQIWDNYKDTDHTIVYFHGIAPEGLVALLPFFSLWCDKNVRFIIPVNPISSFQFLYPVEGILGKVNSALATYLDIHYIYDIHLIGHSAGVAAINAFILKYKEYVTSVVSIDPIHHCWISHGAQKPLMQTFTETFKNMLWGVWNPEKWIELGLISLLHCPSLAGFAIDISNDAACYNFTDLDKENQLFILGEYDTLNNHSIPLFVKKAKKCTIWIKKSYHGGTLYMFDLDKVINFQKKFNYVS